MEGGWHFATIVVQAARFREGEVSLTHASPIAEASSSAGAIRTRRYRERVRSGKVLVRFEMTPAGVDRLVEKGWLDPEKRSDPVAVTNAFLELGVAALWPEKRRR